MVANAERRKVVQKLRRFAREHGVDQVSDTAGKAQVHAMAKAVLEAPQFSAVLP